MKGLVSFYCNCIAILGSYGCVRWVPPPPLLGFHAGSILLSASLTPLAFLLLTLCSMAKTPAPMKEALCARKWAT